MTERNRDEMTSLKDEITEGIINTGDVDSLDQESLHVTGCQ